MAGLDSQGKGTKLQKAFRPYCGISFRMLGRAKAAKPLSVAKPAVCVLDNRRDRIDRIDRKSKGNQMTGRAGWEASEEDNDELRKQTDNISIK